jgi:hypothetical protein
MTKKGLRFPHTISYRLTDEDFLKLLQEVNKTGLTPHDWCRLVVLDRLNQEFGLSKNERILFEQFARTQYLVANGFQLLADDNLTPEEWQKFRTIAREKIDVISHKALTDFQSRSARNRRTAGLGR